MLPKNDSTVLSALWYQPFSRYTGASSFVWHLGNCQTAPNKQSQSLEIVLLPIKPNFWFASSLSSLSWLPTFKINKALGFLKPPSWWLWSLLLPVFQLTPEVLQQLLTWVIALPIFLVLPKLGYHVHVCKTQCTCHTFHQSALTDTSLQYKAQMLTLPFKPFLSFVLANFLRFLLYYKPSILF